MADVVVTVPKWFWREWIAEGDAVDEPYSGEEWGYHLGLNIVKPTIEPGERVYIVAHGKVRGYAPLTRLVRDPERGWVLVRGGGAVAVTIPQAVQGFRAWRIRWWDRSEEIAFPEWKTAGVKF